MTLVQRCPGRCRAHLVWLRALPLVSTPTFVCVARALLISVSRTLPCAPGLCDVRELTWAAVAQVSTCAYLVSAWSPEESPKSRGTQRGYSWREAARPAVPLPSCPGPGRPQVIFLPRPFQGHRPRDQLFQQLLKSRSQARGDRAWGVSLHFSSSVPSAAPASRGQTLVKCPTRAGKPLEAWAREGKEKRDRAPFPPGSH